MKKTAQHIINCAPDTYPAADISELENALKTRESLLSVSVTNGISLILPDPDPSVPLDGYVISKQTKYMR